MLIGGVLFLASGPITDSFAIPDAAWAFSAIALVPVIKGFQHLDARRAQRDLNNRPFLMVEILPQALALALTLPVLRYAPDFGAVVWLSFAQAITMLGVSHLVAERRYALAFDGDILRRLLDFGWPIWLSAFPLIAVYHGDRLMIGRFIGVEDLAGYSAAFMVAMVPGLIAGKVGQALMLPLFSAARDNPALLARRFAVMTEATVLVASAYLATAMLLGGFILEVAFGTNYAGLGGVLAWLSAMWSLRMLQAVPGMALMAAGETKPFLVAGLIRAAALVPAAVAVATGHGLAAVAACGVAGELASLAYVARRLDAPTAGLAAVFLRRALFLAPAALTAGALLAVTPDGDNALLRAAALVVGLLVISAMACAAFPETRSRIGAGLAKALA